MNMDFKQSTAMTVFRGREKYRLWSTFCDKHERVRHMEKQLFKPKWSALNIKLIVS